MPGVFSVSYGDRFDGQQVSVIDQRQACGVGRTCSLSLAKQQVVAEKTSACTSFISEWLGGRCTRHRPSRPCTRAGARAVATQQEEWQTDA